MANKMQQRAIHLNLPKNDKLDIEFQNLSFNVPFGKGKKEILHSISGKFKSGELTAIMGPSGAGKSSLLNILTGFENAGTSGTIRCTGQDDETDSKVKYKRDCCYILQDDRLCPLFTVKEIMNMAAKLKLGYSVSEKAKELVIFDILDTLGLSNTMDTKCSRLSGGQRKRLSIALELIDNPPIMFLDEPTTGLDSSSSLQCVTMLKSLARGGRTIVCTIHQPSATIFEMFDHVYILAEGYCIYQGKSMNTVSYLSRVGLHCPQYHNPADYLLEVANGEYGNFTEKLAKFSTETNFRMLEPSDILVTEKEPCKDEHSKKTTVLIQAPSEWYKFQILFQRCLIQLYRDWTVTQLKLVLHILVGIFVGVLYMNYGNDGSKAIKNVGYFIVSIVYIIYTSMMPAVVKFPSEIPIIKKESFNNWYKLNTYYMAYIMANMPVQVVFSLVYTVISYLISGQPIEVMRMLMVFGIQTIVSLIAESFGLILGTTVNPINGTFLGAILTALFLVLAGFLMLFSHMSKFMYVLSYFSYIAYAMEAMVQAMYGFEREQLPCPPDVSYCHYKSPTILLKDLGMQNSNYMYDLLVLVANLIVMKIVGFCTLRRMIRKGI
ncbi:PREDICTED: ATP-binding cassette sub-family G member 1-like isoform X1 [Nicrophorus vespilloides]|uniref:ATP-binding cassette sub-family G member 1-like isoform X1 n=1 Tax=Nicrophorus vespilloides TaxID=110193 RepID=A0ABM1MM26_NICVS|nr:PREDICTED: ATP-binding cassette sub-family G member 1-like isoform X1 [Nicrophorus vespilloides]